jgi:hypothetical protein
MSPARRPIRRILAVLLLLAVAVAIGLRFLPPTAEQVEALRLLAEPTPPVAGRDGSDALLLVDRDVPAAERAAVAAATRRYLDAHDAHVVADRKAEAARLVDPRDAFAPFPKLGDDEAALCDLHRREVGCLATVRRDPARVAAILARHAGQLEAAGGLVAFDGVRYGLQPSLTQKIPQSYGAGRKLVVTALAERFVRGEHDAAIAATCDDLAAWRRLGADNDHLVGAMVGSAYVTGDLWLLAEMLAERPADSALPVVCDAALAPTRPAELDVCPAMRLEFASVRQMVTSGPLGDSTSGEGRLVRAALDEDHFLALAAPAYGRYCTQALHELAATDRSVVDVAPAVQCGPLEKVAQPIGCIMATALGGEQFARYQDRRTDQAAALALMRTLLWLRAQSPDPAAWPALLPKRPAALGLRRDPLVADDGALLSIENLDDGRQVFFALPLRPVVEAAKE